MNFNFNRYDDFDATVEYLQGNYEAADIRAKLEISELEIVESWARDYGQISSEEELSELFDSEVALSVINQYGADDLPAMSEAFNNWTDALCKDGYLHEVQYSEYCYVGDYS